jgi:hypothetical protein
MMMRSEKINIKLNHYYPWNDVEIMRAAIPFIHKASHKFSSFREEHKMRYCRQGKKQVERVVERKVIAATCCVCAFAVLISYDDAKC